MFKHSLFLVFLFLYSAQVLANTTNYTLFAVDVSLSASDKQAAFEIIRETIRTASEEHSIGLTLFDDTVRDFVKPAQLENQQIAALYQAMAEAPVSARSTSNPTIGIERAIDAFEPVGGANLVVFSRGVIDTKTQDPRAQFIEWLDKVLLPQATQSNIAVSLVVNHNQSTHASNIGLNSKEIKEVFSKTDMHTIISWTSDTQLAPQLTSLLNTSDRAHTQVDPSDESAGDSTTSSNPEGINKQSHASDAQKPFNVRTLPVVRLILLAVCLALLFGIVIWRFRTKRASKRVDHTAHSASSYLPLTRKPSETMQEYMEKETDMAIKPDSRDDQ